MKAFNDVLDREDREGDARASQSLARRRQHARRDRARRHAHRRVARGHGRGRGQRAARSAGGDAEPIGPAARMRSLRVDGRGRRPDPPDAGSAGARRSRDAVARIRGRLFQLPAARRVGGGAARSRHARHPRRARPPEDGGRAGRHDRGRRAGPERNDNRKTNRIPVTRSLSISYAFSL